ncbi:TPA_asm: UL32.5 uORF [Human alphaherpesvirus 1]|nr:TPA_asm: UL32.5 uORF [Human alphaherpesvirus 1]
MRARVADCARNE